MAQKIKKQPQYASLIIVKILHSSVKVLYALVDQSIANAKQCSGNQPDSTWLIGRETYVKRENSLWAELRKYLII